MPSFKTIGVTLVIAIVAVGLIFRISALRKVVVGDATAVKTWSA